MKFIHVGDLHFGACPEAERGWERERQKDIEQSFSQVIALANEEQADFLFLCGDIFHKRPALRDLKHLDSFLSQLDGTKVFMIAGNHDFIDEDSAYLKYRFSAGVHLFSGREPERVYEEKQNTYIYGFSYHSREITEPLYDGLKPGTEDGIHILLGHGGDSTHIPIDFHKLKWSGFDYAALGHIHRPEMISEDLIAYGGSLEPLNRTETGRRGVFLGEITDEKKVVHFLPVNQKSYVEVPVDLTAQMDGEEILSAAEEEMKMQGENQMFTLLLQGQKPYGVRPDFDLLSAKYRIVDIIDRTQNEKNAESLPEDNKDNIIGAVLQRLDGMEEAKQYAQRAFEQASRGLKQRRSTERREEKKHFYIRNIHIDGFGKFCGKELPFKPGLNIVYGPNESGKTTIKHFLMHMLFGLEKSRGIAARSDAYTIYMPVYGGNYGGIMEIESDGHAFLLERSFRTGEKACELFDKETGEKVPLSSLYSLSLGAYTDTFCIQEGDIPPSGNLSMELTNYTSNLTGSNTADVKIDLALKALKEEKSVLRRKNREETILLSEKRERYLKAPEPDKKEEKPKSAFLFLLAAAVFAAAGFVHPGFFAGCAVFLALCFLSFKSGKQERTEQKDFKEELRREYQILKEQTDRTEYNINQADAAIQAVLDAANEFRENLGEQFNEKVSEIVSYLTGGVYEKVKIDESLSFMVKYKNRFIDLKYLSAGTVEQIYLAVRLAAGEILYPTEPVPVLMDDIFGNFDDERTRRALDYLSRHSGRQLILFTCKKELFHQLDRRNQQIHWISLKETGE
ncbi:AAA family ATPase [Anaerostipes sp.]|uniref:AAA family ATPase n=1 Tax=Anaerostipes sp. TaxID=1872530 RepID=UPI0025C1B14D|nr:AAA family ATPase [Anaerostipes sp.]MBS7009511.1 AAA family ATPase [Anaerostipes sp.]